MSQQHHLRRLSAAQRACVGAWFGDDVEVVADHSWPLQTTVVLEVETARGRVILKASGGELQDHHLTREHRAHRELLAGLRDEVAELLHADLGARLLATRYLPGVLARGSAWEHDPRVLRQAGAMLTRLHRGRPPETSLGAAQEMLARAHWWLGQAEHLIARADSDRVRRLLHAHPTRPVTLVPTHGDFQPRNWLVDVSDLCADGAPRLRLIDFGRSDLRVWHSDLTRLDHQVFAGRPDLAAAFYEGAGRDPRCPIDPEEAPEWLLERLGAALGTIAWAHGIGDDRFEAQGHAMLARVLEG